jgi:hypothetical protein
LDITSNKMDFINAYESASLLGLDEERQMYYYLVYFQ